ncbi:MAG: response regulator transcription factor [Rhodobacteraceae bacterium]|nr:response regulator transcription factor [Paracoccaceae bacterium]
MKVLLVDDHQLIRDAMMHYINSSTKMELVAAESIDDGLKKVKEHGGFSCVLADLRMPGVSGAFDLKPLVDANSPNPTMLFSGAATYIDVYAARRAGVAGLVRKSMSAKQVVEIVATVVKNPDDLPHDVAFGSSLQRPTGVPSQLGDEDWVILEMLARGARNSEIAQALGVKRVRIENRLRKIYRYIGVPNRLGAANYVNGLV